MMKKRIFTLLLLLFTCLSVSFAQDYKKESEVIKVVKQSVEYLYGESTMETSDEAFETAKALLKAKIETELVAQFEMNKSDIEEVSAKSISQLTRVDIKSGDMNMVFVFLAKDNIKGEEMVSSTLIDELLALSSDKEEIKDQEVVDSLPVARKLTMVDILTMADSLTIDDVLTRADSVALSNVLEMTDSLSVDKIKEMPEIGL